MSFVEDGAEQKPHSSCASGSCAIGRGDAGGSIRGWCCQRTIRAKNASRAGVAVPVRRPPLSRTSYAIYYQPASLKSASPENLEQSKEDIYRIEVDAGRHQDWRQSRRRRRATARSRSRPSRKKMAQRQPRVDLRMHEPHENRDHAEARPGPGAAIMKIPWKRLQVQPAVAYTVSAASANIPSPVVRAAVDHTTSGPKART